MQEETGPSSEGSPSETNISPETTGGTQTPDRESATEEQLQKLVIGSNAEPQKSEDVVYTSETPPDQVPGEVDNSPETTGDAQTPNEGSTTEDQPGEEIPPDVPIPQDSKTGEKDPQLNIRTGAATWKNQDSDVPVEVTGHLGEINGRHYVSIAESETGVPLDEIQYPTDEPEESSQSDNAQPPEQPEQKAGFGQRIMGRLGKALGRSTESPTPGQPGTEQPTQKQILQGKIDERRVAFETAEDVSSINLNNGQLQGVKFDTERSNPYVVRGVDGNNRYLSEDEFDKILKSDIAREEKQVIVERKEAAKDEKEQDKAERKEQKSKYKEAKSASKEYLEQKVANLRDQLENPTKFNRASSNQAITLDGRQYQYVKYAPDEFSNPYLVRDETGNDHYLSKDEINRALRHEANLESQVKLDNLKPKTQEKPAKQKVSKEEAKAEKDRQKRAEAYAKFKERKDKEPELEQEKGPSAIQKLAEKTLPGKIFYRQAMALLNNYNLKDRNMVAWATGAGLGVANTAAAMFLPGPGTLAAKFIRLGIGVGFTRAVSFGLNPLRSWAEGKVLDKAGVTNPTQRNELKEDFASNHQLLREGKFDDYIKAQNETSRKAMLKEGQIENWATDLARAALIRDMENIQSRFENYNKSAKDLVAGAMALSLAGGLGIGAISIFSSGGDSIAPGDGGAGDAPETDDAPTEAPVGDADTPTTEPGTDTTVDTEPTPTEPPSLSEILENPEYASSLEIQQGDTIGQLLTDGGYDIDWGPDNAQVFGAHIEANYDMLQGMNEQVAATGISVEDFPTQGEISTLVSQARAGDAVAMHHLTEAMHWIPAGGEFTILSPEAVELINNPQGV